MRGRQPSKSPDKSQKEKNQPNLRSTLMLIFQNELQFDLFNARCHDSGEKMDVEKAKMFKEEMSKINSKKNPTVLNLYSMRLGVNSIMKLTSLLKNKDFEVLNLADNAVSEYGVHAIKSLINSCNIQQLNLSSNMISEVGLSLILDDLIKNSYLKGLDLGILEGAVRKNSFGVDGARCLAALIIQNKKLETLKLEDNDIGIAGAEILAIALKQNTTLKNFKLAQNHIKVVGAQQILRKAMNLVSLDLGKNFIKSSIGPTLKSYVQLNTNLRRLNLELNELFSDGVKVLCKGLMESKLVSLNLKGNSIRDEGLEYISQLFSAPQSKIRETLQQLDVSLNQITPEGMVHFNSILLSTSLRSLNLSKNYLGDQGIIVFSEAAEKIPSKINLSKLDISSSKVSDAGIVKFVQALECFPQLQHIKCLDNYISEKHEKLLVEMLGENTTLVSFLLTGNRLSLASLKQVKKITDRNQKDLEQKEPNKIKSEIFRLKEKQKKVNQTKEQLEVQSKQIVALEQAKAKLLENIAKLEKQESQKKADYDSMIQKKKQEIDKKRVYIKTKVEQLENQKVKQGGVLQKLKTELKEVTEKRSDLEYQIKTVQEETRMIEKEFTKKIDEVKNK